MSWQDFDAWLSHLRGHSAFRRLVDPIGVFADTEPDLMLKLIDEIRTLQWQIAGANPDHAPPPMIDRLRARFAQREAEQAQADTATVVDIDDGRTRREDRKELAAPREKSQRPSNIRERIARAQAAHQ